MTTFTTHQIFTHKNHKFPPRHRTHIRVLNYINDHHENKHVSTWVLRHGNSPNFSKTTKSWKNKPGPVPISTWHYFQSLRNCVLASRCKIIAGGNFSVLTIRRCFRVDMGCLRICGLLWGKVWWLLCMLWLKMFFAWKFFGIFWMCWLYEWWVYLCKGVSAIFKIWPRNSYSGAYRRYEFVVDI